MLRTSHWLDWTRTDLSETEAAALLAALTTDQREHLAREDYVWVEGMGVVFRDPQGGFRRARFTHGTHFRTRRGEFYIGSGGKVIRVAPPDPELPT
jgi:hypothetical protein